MSATFNVSEFDRTVKEFYEGSHAEMQAAQKTLTNFQHDLNSWQVVDQILEQSSYLQTKFIALNIFEEFVKVRWNTLPKEQRFALRNYIANLVIHISSNENAIAVQDLLLGKLNVVLIQIDKLYKPSYQLLALQCLNGIIGSNNKLLNETVVAIYNMTLPEINKLITAINTNSNEREIILIKETATFLINMLTCYKECIDNPRQALLYLLAISRVPDNDLFKLCAEYWEVFLKKDESYKEIEQQLAVLMIENMVMPNDILLIENEDGEITREFIKQSDTAALYDTMQCILQTIAKREPYLIRATIHEKLSQIRASFSNAHFHDMLFKTSWAIGALSDTMETEQENDFIGVVVQDYIQLSQYNNGDDWAITSCILYISGQYTRFLFFQEDFMKFVLQKILSYMHELNDDIKNMACDTLLKISRGICKQPAGNMFLLDILLKDIEVITKELNSHQVCMVYEAAANMISIVSPLSLQQQYLNNLLDKQNKEMTSYTMENSVISLKRVIQYLKINIAVCKAIGIAYSHQFIQITPFMIQYYKVTNSFSNGTLCKYVKQLILELLETLILQIKMEVNIPEIQTLLQIILIDYSQEANQREPRVLSLLTAIFEKIENPIITVWSNILNETIQIEFVHTLPMISQNFSEFPEIREQFYILLRTIVQKYFQDLFRTPELVQYVINSILWGTKHVQTEVSHISLQTCLNILEEIVEEDDDISSQFFETYYVRILTDMLEILVDPDRFEYQSQILARMLKMIQEGEIYTRIFIPEQVSDPLMSNMEFLQQYILNILTNAFPMLQKDQIEVLVMGMFDYSDDLERFQEDIQDFLVDIREVDEASVGQQRAQEEREAELELLGNLQ
ncbi:hypothetical protein G6F57_005630 [Rhizopus arrhizus]|nr:hypothetical protein G6F30_006776 [Rhizopus arrhizus]KAG1424870.1 hypothetical protein G6F58_002192 [Rhizopus delemar]KAG0980681.1 hypothetical protein G6F29_007643 [Rhizopus arrhizus]KAG0993740.1 hypothetical protein G6F28_006404 [Rhizopus arrhizus]KAG1007912.1 hypothetical protein G6F27_006981 [Rhizopus arrhizus]